MSKAILISDRPQWTVKILKGIKNVEARKKFNPNYRGWVYVYNTLREDIARIDRGAYHDFVLERDITEEDFKRMDSGYTAKGMVVARYYADEVYVYDIKDPKTWEDEAFAEQVMNTIGMTLEQLHEYVGNKEVFYGIHISQLEIFDRPRPLSDFVRTKYGKPVWIPVSKAPQSYCFVVV